jgi:hypothetical protein
MRGIASPNQPKADDQRELDQGHYLHGLRALLELVGAAVTVVQPRYVSPAPVIRGAAAPLRTAS